MRRFSLLFSCLLIVLETGLLGAQVETVDTVDVAVEWVSGTDSVVAAAAGLSQGVTLATKALIYVPVQYSGATYKNRIARGTVIAVEENTCRVKIVASTARVRPGYRVLLYGLSAPVSELAGEKPPKVPFYKKRWFWLASSAAATAIVITLTRGSGKSNTGTVVITGDLP